MGRHDARPDHSGTPVLFPGCDRTPAWTQAHHFIEFVAGGPTSLDNCGLVCGFHHRQFARNGWISVMVNAAPHWIPPPWVDPDQEPPRNTMHDPPMNLVTRWDCGFNGTSLSPAA
jgi:hypothetical protein